MRHSLLLLTLVAASASGCDKSQSTSTTAPNASGPSLASLAQTAREAEGVEKIELRISADGGVAKHAVYHSDASLIPQPVKDRAQAEFPGSQVSSYESEHYADLGDVYEVEVQTAEGMSCEVAATADGKLLYTECSEDPANTPEAIQSAVASALPGGTIEEYEVKKGEGIDEVTVEVKADGREYYLRLLPSGTVLETRLRVPALIEVPLP